jgi:hypothetical protein
MSISCVIFIDHYYAKALHQYYDSLERFSRYKDGGLEEEMRAVTMKALEKFWSITQMPMDEDNTILVARSFAYIGQMILMEKSSTQTFTSFTITFVVLSCQYFAYI